MSAYLMQARSSSSGALVSWTSLTPDFAGSSFPGPGLPEYVAVSGVNKTSSGGGGGGTTPLSLNLFVDADFAGGNGHISTPFGSVQDAVDAAPDGATIWIVKTETPENITVTGKTIVLAAFRVICRRPLGGGYSRNGANIELGDITTTGVGSLTISGVTVGDISAQGTVKICNGCEVGGTITTTHDVIASDSDFQAFISSGFDCDFTACRFHGSNALVGTEGTLIRMQDCSFPGGTTVSVGFDVPGGSLQVDAITNFRWKAKTESITNGTKTIIGDLSA